MIDDYLSKNLKPGEQLIRVVRRFPLLLVIRVGLLGFLGLADFFCLTWLFQKGLWGVGVFVVVLLMVIIGIYRSWYIWSLNVLIITNLRVIDVDQKGIFSRTVSEASFRKIQDVSYTVSGLGPTLLHYGRVSIQTAGSQAAIELEYIRYPEKVQEMITSIQEQSNQNENQISNKTLETKT